MTRSAAFPATYPFHLQSCWVPDAPSARRRWAPSPAGGWWRRPAQCSRGSATVAAPSLAGRGLPEIHERSRRGEQLARLQQCLEPREYHRPAAVELAVRHLAELV